MAAGRHEWGWMTGRRVGLVLLAAAAAGAGIGYWRTGSRSAGDDPRLLSRLSGDTVPAAAASWRHPQEDALFARAAERAWAYIDQSYEPRTGLIRTVREYPVATVWDMGSGLAALMSARELGLVERPVFEERMGRALATLQRLELFDGAAFNKTYATASGRMLGRDDAPSTRGYGWSAIDLGRLLIWLRIVAEREPRFAADARRVVERLDLARVVRAGLLWGEDLDSRGRPRTYPEGTLGYEQYAARGFALWGYPADKSLSVTASAQPLELWGETLLVDRRPRDCLTSEPFVLTGLELGWSPGMRLLAESVLRVQQARFERTGQLTIASEDASLVPPHHFYYYCVYAEGSPFQVFAAGHAAAPDGPRTVSVKAAWGWYALLPGEYTGRALDHITAAWTDTTTLITGVEEGTGAPAGPPNVNTAAVLLEAAAYRARGRPLLGS